MKVLLIVNAYASSVTARNTVVVHRTLSANHDVELVETNRRGHATRFALDAARRGVDVVIGYGGDGTLNEVATGIAGTDTALGVLPGGSTNVFARTIGLPNDPVLAAQWLAAGLDHDDLRPIGLGQVNGRYFCFHTGIGYDAAAVRNVEQNGDLKRYFGHPYFVGAALATYFTSYRRSEPHFRVTSPDHGTIDNGYFSLVFNTSPYTYLGNRALDLSGPVALDEPLCVVTLTSMHSLAMIRSLARGFTHGGPIDHESVITWRNVRDVAFEHRTAFPYQLDGDYLGETPHLDFCHIPEAVKMVFPRSPDD